MASSGTPRPGRAAPTAATPGFTVWLAGDGVKPDTIHAATDRHSFYATENNVHTRALHATLLYLLGLDHTRLDIHTPVAASG